MEKRLKTLTESIKKDLEGKESVKLELPKKIYWGNGISLSDIVYENLVQHTVKKTDNNNDKVRIEITKKELEDKVKPLLEKTCKEALDDAKISKEDLKGILFVGKQSRIPLILNSMSNISCNSRSVVRNFKEPCTNILAEQSNLIDVQFRKKILQDLNINKPSDSGVGTIFCPILSQNIPL